MDTVWNEIFTLKFVQSLRANCDLATILSFHFAGKLLERMLDLVELDLRLKRCTSPSFVAISAQHPCEIM